MQTGEIIIIAILALIVLGPTRLPEVAHKLGEWTAELRQAARDITSGLEAEVAEIKGVGEALKGPIDEVTKPLTAIGEDLDSAARGLEWKGPKPVSGPTPEDAMRDLEAIDRITPERPTTTAGEHDEPDE